MFDWKIQKVIFTDQEINEISRKPADKLEIRMDNKKNLDLKLTGTKIKVKKWIQNKKVS